jgi:hypothetical protein
MIPAGVTLSVTRFYDFVDPVQRGEWLDILVALVEMLKSGELKVSFLNNSVTRKLDSGGGERKTKKETRGRHKFKGLRRAVVLGTRGYVLHRLLNEVWT